VVTDVYFASFYSMIFYDFMFLINILCNLRMCNCITAVAVCDFATTYSDDHSKEGIRRVLAAAA